MKRTAIMPDMGENISRGVVSHISVSPGDKIEIGTTLIEVEADKTLLEVPSEFSGSIEKIMVHTGEDIVSGHPIALISTMGTLQQKTSASPVSAKQSDKSGKNHSEVTTLPRDDQASPALSPSQGRYYAGPSAHRLARELGVSLDKVKSSSADHRISIGDIKNYVHQSLHSRSEQNNRTSRLPYSKNRERAIQESSETADETRTPQATIIGSHLSRHQFQVDITQLEAARRQIKSQICKNTEITLETCLLQAIAQALKTSPLSSSLPEEKQMRPGTSQQIDFKLALKNSFIPLSSIITNIDQLTLLEIENQLRRGRQETSKSDLTSTPGIRIHITFSNLKQADREKLFAENSSGYDLCIVAGDPFSVKDNSNKTSTEQLKMNLLFVFDQNHISNSSADWFQHRLTKLLENPILLALQ